MRRAIAAAIVGLLLLGAAPAAAETLRPTRFGDPAPGRCKPRDCSLREAVIAANKSPAATKIVLAKGKYRLKSRSGLPEPKTGDLDVIGPATIVGRGPKRTAILAGSFDRVIQLGAIGRIGRPDYAIRKLSVRLGDAGAEDGGGILVGFSDTTLTAVAIVGNDATNGGGIASTGALITIVRSTIAGNDASGTGGGLFLPQTSNLQEASVRTSTFSSNTAAIGGGIALEGEPPPQSSDHPTLDLVNSTLAGNTVTVSGGGIHANNASIVTVDNATIVDNFADSDGTGGGAGGGVRQATATQFALTDSILAKNTVGASGFGSQCDGEFAPSEGNVLVGQTGMTCSINALVAADALIGPLGQNGGPTRTIPLLAGSPAIGFAVACPPKDQRGVPRTADCDAGAFERPGP